MVKKRSCVGDSQNCGDIGFLNQHNSPDPTMPADVSSHSHRSILYLSSPPNEPEHGGQVRDLDSCYQCGKKFDLSQDIYMYRECGFCSLECRDAKIAIDIAAEQKTTSSRGMNC